MATAIIVVTALIGFYMAWTIGANDVANSMGPVVGSRAISLRQAVIIAGLCEFAGAVLVGSDVTNTIRKGIVDPARLAGTPEVLCLGMMCALLSTALWLHLATWLGMPVSTSHTIVGAVLGVGFARGIAAVNRRVARDIFGSWLLTVPAAAGCAVLLFLLGRLLGADDLIRSAITAAR